MTSEVEQAIQLIRDAFGEHTINVTEESQGGAYVEIIDISLSETYAQGKTWIGFLITFQYPEAEVYPHFVRPDLSRRDGKNLEGGFSRTSWRNKEVTQLSRKTKNFSPDSDHALTKLMKVIEWLNSQ